MKKPGDLGSNPSRAISTGGRFTPNFFYAVYPKKNLKYLVERSISMKVWYIKMSGLSHEAIMRGLRQSVSIEDMDFPSSDTVVRLPDPKLVGMANKIFLEAKNTNV